MKDVLKRYFDIENAILSGLKEITIPRRPDINNRLNRHDCACCFQPGWDAAIGKILIAHNIDLDRTVAQLITMNGGKGFAVVDGMLTHNSGTGDGCPRVNVVLDAVAEIL